MAHKLVLGLLVAAALGLAAPLSYAADPTLHQVYQAAEAGNYRGAQSMMDQVLRDHPNSAKAHFVEAELLAKQGKLASAKAELNKAEQLDSTMAFAKPSALSELNERLAAPAAAARPRAYQAAPAQMLAPAQAVEAQFPWGLVLVGLGLLAAVIFFMRRRQQQSVTYSGMPVPAGGMAPRNGWGQSPQPYGQGGVGPMAPTGGGIGSGILGGLATGAAVGVGMIAAESLMHRVMDGGQHASGNFVPTEIPQAESQSQYDMGGNDFGVSDSTSWDDGGSGGSSGGDDWS